MTNVIIVPPASAPYIQTWWSGGAIFDPPNNAIVDGSFKNFQLTNAAAEDDIALLDSLMHTHIGTVPPGEKLIVIGHSRGGSIIYKWMRQMQAASDLDVNKLLFISSGNPERKYNGALSVDPVGHSGNYPGTQPYGNGYGLPEPASSIRYPILDIARQYDQWADHPGDLSDTASHDAITNNGYHTDYSDAPPLGLDGYPADWNDFTVVAVEGLVTYLVCHDLTGESFPGGTTPAQPAYKLTAQLYGDVKRRADQDYGLLDAKTRDSMERSWRRPCGPPDYPKRPRVYVNPPKQWRYNPPIQPGPMVTGAVLTLTGGQPTVTTN